MKLPRTYCDFLDSVRFYRPHNIRITEFDAEPFLWRSLISGIPHLLSSKPEVGKHQPMRKPKPTSSYLNEQSMPDRQIASSILVQYVQKQRKKTSDDQAYAKHVQGTERSLEQ